MRRKFTKVITATATLMLLAGAARSADAAVAQVTTNPYSPAYNHPYRHGVMPTLETAQAIRSYDAARSPALAMGMAATSANTLSYGGGYSGYGVLSGHPKVYLVVYGSQWGTAGTDTDGNMTLSNDPVGAVPYLQRMFQGLGTAGELWSGVLTQYCDGAAVSNAATSCPDNANFIAYPTGGGVFAGIWYDSASASPASATQSQLSAEALRAAQHFGNNDAASNRYAQYVILSPTGTTPDGFNTSSGNFCAWHSATGFTDPSTSSYVPVPYTNMPYVYDAGYSCGQNYVNGGTQGYLDGFSIVEGHEYAETMTDALPGYGWVNASSGEENADECAWIHSGQGASANVAMSTGSFAMQSTWSNDTDRCEIAHAIKAAFPIRDDLTGQGMSSLIMFGQGALNIGTIADAGSTTAIASGYYPVATADLNGDSFADIIWTSANRDLYLWLGGPSGFTPKYMGTYPAGWILEGAGDINGDGKGDLVWLNDQSHQFAYWLMDGAKRTGWNTINVASGYYPVTMGDFDGNGKLDIVWTSAKHDLYMWLGNGKGFASSYVTTYPAGWRIVGSGILGSSGRDDLIWETTDGSQWGYWLMNGAKIAKVASFSVPGGLSGYSIVANGDYDGDSLADIIWSNGSSVVPWLNDGVCSTTVSCTFTSQSALPLPSNESVYNSSLPSALQVTP